MNRVAPHWAFAVVATADTVLAMVGSGRPDLRRARVLTKPMLMPALAATLPRGWPTGPVGAALALSTMGDVALLGRSEAAFTAGLGSFLGAHAAYLVALHRQGGTAGLRARPGRALPAAALAVGAGATVARRAGSMRGPVTVYTGVIASMLALATGTGRRRVIAGASLFCLSDLLIAIDRFVRAVPAADAWVMATYTSGQALLTDGLTRAAA